MSYVPGISPCFGGDIGSVDRTVFPSPNEVIVPEISPGRLLKETTGWGQRQLLLPGVRYLASSFQILLLSPLPSPTSIQSTPAWCARPRGAAILWGGVWAGRLSGDPSSLVVPLEREEGIWGVDFLE